MTNTLTEHARGGGAWTLREGERLGGYKVIRPLGRGGMGEVYLVENVEMGKPYALKVLPAELADDAQFRERFRREARVMADLDHPGIVRVNHMAEDGGRFFLVMDYVEGPGGDPRTLGDLLADREEFAPGEARRLALELAEALAYAHSRGVVHRDIKPANVLLDREDRAKLSDFGLARVVGDEYMRKLTQKSISVSLARTGAAGGDALSLTESENALIGTYEYMSPEQQSGKAADERSDIYSLGLVIYRALTGEQAKGRFPDPSELGCSKWWDGVIGKALASARERRYASAAELARDLARARAPRRGGLKFAAGVVALLIVVGAVVAGLFVSAGLRRRRRPKLVGQRQQTPVEHKIQSERQSVAEGARRKIEEDRKRREAEAEAATLLAAARTLRESGLLDKARDKMAEALAAVPDHVEAKRLLLELQAEIAAKKAEAEQAADCKRWMGKALELKLSGKLEEAAHAYVKAAEYAPLGSREAADAAASCRVEYYKAQAIDAEGRGDLGRAVEFYGKALAARGDRATREALAQARKKLDARRAEETRRAAAALWRSRAQQAEGRGDLKSALGYLREAEKQGANMTQKIQEIGNELAYKEAMQRARALVRQETWKEAAAALERILRLRPGDQQATSLLSEMRVAEKKARVRSYKWWQKGWIDLSAHAGDIRSVAFSPDGQRLVTAAKDTTVALWEVTTGRLSRRFEGHRGPVGSVAFSSSNRLLATGSEDGSCALWDVRTGSRLRTLGHGRDTRAVAFSPDGSYLATGHAWQVTRGRTIHEFGEVVLWELPSGRRMNRRLAGPMGKVRSIAFSRDGRYLAAADYDFSVVLWDASTGNRIRAFKNDTGNVCSIAFSPDGRYLATAGAGAPKVWDTNSGRRVRSCEEHGSQSAHSLALSPDGRSLATGQRFVAMVTLSETLTGGGVRSFKWSGGGIQSVAFSPDGRLLAAGCRKGSARIWLLPETYWPKEK